MVPRCYRRHGLLNLSHSRLSPGGAFGLHLCGGILSTFFVLLETPRHLYPSLEVEKRESESANHAEFEYVCAHMVHAMLSGLVLMLRGREAIISMKWTTMVFFLVDGAAAVHIRPDTFEIVRCGEVTLNLPLLLHQCPQMASSPVAQRDVLNRVVRNDGLDP